MAQAREAGEDGFFLKSSFTVWLCYLSGVSELPTSGALHLKGCWLTGHSGNVDSTCTELKAVWRFGGKQMNHACTAHQELCGGTAQHSAEEIMAVIILTLANEFCHEKPLELKYV